MSTSEKAPQITVIQAVYGAVQGTAEVTKIVQGLASGGKSFTANNATLTPGTDPAKGHDKHFAMVYTVGSSRFAFACKENETVSLRTKELPRGPVTVVAAAYGAIDKNDPATGARDVTAIVQELLDSNPGSGFKFKPTNKLFGDPTQGPRKNFGMIYSPTNNLGKRIPIASDEDQEVTVKL